MCSDCLSILFCHFAAFAVVFIASFFLPDRVFLANYDARGNSSNEYTLFDDVTRKRQAALSRPSSMTKEE